MSCARAPACSPSPRWASPGALVMHSMGWAQQSNYAQVRALAAGQARDRPLALGDQGQGAGSTATSTPSRRRAWRRSPFPRIWRSTPPAPSRSPGMRPPTPGRQTTPGGRPPDHPYVSEYGYSAQRAHRVEVRVENAAPIDLGADPGGGGDPGGRAAAAGSLGRGADRAGLRHRSGDHAGAGDDRDDLRRRVLLSRDRRDTGVRGLRAAVPRARGPARIGLGRRRRPARRPRGQLRIPARAAGGDPVRLRGRPRPRRLRRAAPTPPGPRSAPPRRSPSTCGRLDRRFASPTRTRSPFRDSPATPSWG